MGSFVPENINEIQSQVGRVTDGLPASMSQFVGPNSINPGQLGANPAITKLQNIAPNQQPQIKQQSAHPYKKPVSFMLLDRNGGLARLMPGDESQFSPGYYFKMLINPSNFAITLPPKTANPIRTLGGWKIQHWYPDIGTISADGIIGNMLERYNRDLKDSTAWRGFKKLITIYQRAGVAYIPSGSNKDRRSAQKEQFSPRVVCIFDKMRYEGYFEGLNYTEAEDTPHTLKYSFNYRFTSMVDLGDIPGVTREDAIDASIANTASAASRNAVTSARNSSDALNSSPLFQSFSDPL